MPDIAHDPLFPISPRARVLYDRVKEFMRERVMPREKLFDEQVAAGPTP